MKTCLRCKSQFEITDGELKFLDKISPVFLGIKYNIPEPKLCPCCRQKRRLHFRNERSLYKRKCDLTDKSIISIYNPNKDYKVFSSSAFFGDRWSGLDYGREFDFQKTFTEQFNDLVKQVPHLSSIVMNSENCDYTGFCVDSKDCYMSVRLGNAERVYYSYLAVESCLDCIDCLHIVSCELCYEAIDSEKCYGCKFIQDLKNCSSCYYCFNCIGCSECFGCTNLRNKKYYFFNEQFTKEEYEAKVNDIYSKNSQNEIRKIFDDFKVKQIHKENSNINIENVLGNRINNSKNIYYGFDLDSIEDGIYINGCEKGRDQMDGDFLFYGEKMYEQLSCSHSYNSLFSYASFESNNVLYSFSVYSCKNIFGCANLRNGKYCILNKQYSEEEYNKMVPRIIEHMIKTGEWGEFLHEKLSPFEYEETAAEEYFPKEQSGIPLRQGFVGQEGEEVQSNKEFNLIPQELEFYEKMGIEIPTKHPNVRYFERLKRRNPRKLFDRNCDKCGKSIKTTYSPERPEVVYCETCYLQTVY